MVERLVYSEANTKRIQIVEHCFGSSGVPLTKPGRVLVGEGVLTKLCRKRNEPRQFYLFNDILVYGSIIIDKKKYSKQHIIPLEDVKVQSIENEGPWKHGWQIISPQKSFVVFAATANEKAEWMAHINKCIVDILAKTCKKPASDFAAVWVPDRDAGSCMHCLKVKFTPISRRHHCRKCGAVVCGACSSKKFLLPYMSSKPLRVCTRCYDVLSSAQAEKDSHLTEPQPSTVSTRSAASSDYEVQEGWNEDEQHLYPSHAQIYESSDDDDEGEGDKEQAHGELGTINTEPTFYHQQQSTTQ